MRQWAIHPGFWISFLVDTILAPASPLILGTTATLLLSAVVGLGMGPARLPLALAALWLFLLATLRLTSGLRVLTQPGRGAAVRACGFGAATGLACWNWLAEGLAPMRWLGAAGTAPLPRALWAVAGLAATCVLLTLASGWVVRWGLLGGLRERRRRARAAALLATGSGPSGALRLASMVGWLRQRGAVIWIPCGAFALPAGMMLMRQPLDEPGMAIAACAFTLLIPYWLRGNLLGMDAGGAWRYPALGVRPSDVLVQRGLALHALQALLLAPTFAWAVASRPGGWAGVSATIAFVVATLALEDGLGTALSRILADPTGRTDDGRDLTAGAMWIFAVGVSWPPIFVIAFILTWPGPAAWVWPAATACLCLLARGIVVRRLRRASVDTWGDRLLTRLGAT